jgi:hypothetical protein
MELTDTYNVTELEKQVLKNIINSEYMDVTGKDMINWAVWTFSVTNEDKQLAGALGSLVKKGLCSVEEEESETVCYLTKEGFECIVKYRLT